MVHRSKDARKDKSPLNGGQELAKSLNWILDHGSFLKIHLHGNTKWTVRHLVCVAILWVWSDHRSLVHAANDTFDKTTEIFGSSGIRSYQVLTNALIKYGDLVLRQLARRLHQLMEQFGGKTFRIGIWTPFAIDGTRFDAPRTLRNEAGFCKPRSTKKKKKKKKNGYKRHRYANPRPPVSKKSHYDPQPVGPQVWLSLLWHVGLKMPWAWRIGPSFSSERTHLLEMLESEDLPENSLICGDAGFVGYDFWKAIDTLGNRFMCRVGNNCSFLKLLGKTKRRNDLVYCWPKEHQTKGKPPLTFRLLCFNDGHGEVYVVTNELDSKRLSDKLASEIYRQRWGVEVQIRDVKQTFERSKLLGRTPQVATVELNWSVMGLWIAQLFAWKEQKDIPNLEAKPSIAKILQIVRQILRRPDVVSLRGQGMQAQLSRAVTDTYKRTSKKKSRNYPKKKTEPRTGAPNVIIASKEIQEKIETIQINQTAA